MVSLDDGSASTYFVSLRVESMSKCDYIRVEKFLHYLQFSVFVPFVLINFLDCYYFTCFSDTCLHTKELDYSNALSTYLEDYPERAISYYSICVVCEALLK